MGSNYGVCLLRGDFCKRGEGVWRCVYRKQNSRLFRIRECESGVQKSYGVRV